MTEDQGLPFLSLLETYRGRPVLELRFKAIGHTWFLRDGAAFVSFLSSNGCVGSAHLRGMPNHVAFCADVV